MVEGNVFASAASKGAVRLEFRPLQIFGCDVQVPLAPRKYRAIQTTRQTIDHDVERAMTDLHAACFARRTYCEPQDHADFTVAGDICVWPDAALITPLITIPCVAATSKVAGSRQPDIDSTVRPRYHRRAWPKPLPALRFPPGRRSRHRGTKGAGPWPDGMAFLIQAISPGSSLLPARRRHGSSDACRPPDCQ